VDFVAKPKLGYEDPAEVRAEVEFSLHRVAHNIRAEWDTLREHDVVFLLQVVEATPERRAAVGVPPARKPVGGAGRGGHGHGHGHGRGGGDRDKDAGKDRSRENRDEEMQQEAKAMVVSIRGAEVVQVLDEAKRVLNDPSAEPSERDKPPVGTKRTLRLLLDPSQYQRDLEAGNVGLYDKFNIVVRALPCAPGLRPWLPALFSHLPLFPRPPPTPLPTVRPRPSCLRMWPVVCVCIGFAPTSLVLVYPTVARRAHCRCVETPRRTTSRPS
jgi:hypothetical protein